MHPTRGHEALQHACCLGQPRGLCADHDAQGSHFMHALFYEYSPAHELWISQHHRLRDAVRVATCRRDHGPDCSRPDCVNSPAYQHPKPKHRPPNGHIWDATSGVWVADPTAEVAQPKPQPPTPPSAGAGEHARRAWLSEYSAFAGEDYRFPDDYRKAYKKATRPADDDARRAKARRESSHQQRTDREGHAAKRSKMSNMNM